MPPARKPVIGLLGGIGAGKSLVARQMASLGCGVIDADRLAREALDEPEVRRRLAQWWGEAVLNPDGSVDRKAVAQRVFGDKEELRRLEELVHPRVHAARQELRRRYQADPALVAVVEDCPLLLEKQIARECDVLVFVEAPWEQRLARVRSRGWTAEELERREKNQAGLDMKKRAADYVIANNADEAHCLSQVRRVLSQILHRENPVSAFPPARVPER